MEVEIIRKTRLVVYAFDVDETLEISNGPVKIQTLIDLKAEGHIVGICGNWAGFCHRIHNWKNMVSFINAGTPNKETFLADLRRWIPADDFIFVGNTFGVDNGMGFPGGSDDKGACDRVNQAGFLWRFIREIDFANGAR